EQRAQGWTPFVLDTNGNGRRDDYVDAKAPVDPEKDKRVMVGLYAVAVNPNDGSVWGTSLAFPGYVVRVAPGPDPTHTALTEIYEPPFPGWRHRPQRRVLGVALERASRRVRPQEVQGAE